MPEEDKYVAQYESYVSYCKKLQVEPIEYENFVECQAYLEGALK